MTVVEAIRRVVEGSDLAREQTAGVFNEIMGGGASDAQIASLLTALRIKGETIEEITGAAQVMREKVTRVLPGNREHLIDTCGTGGDGSRTFNISTAAALVAAGAGARVAKHGNRSVSSSCGSADVLEALGIDITIGPETMKTCLDEIGIAFLFAPSLHKAMKYAIGPRKQMGIRTIFNILGPLTNPALADRQLLGVFSRDLAAPLASVLKNLGSTRAYVVNGNDPLDEISLSDETHVVELADGHVSEYTVTPEQFGLSRVPLSGIAGGDAATNASLLEAVLTGRDTGPHRDVVILNAGFALSASGIAADPKQGIEAAAASIDSGAAWKKVEALRKLTKK